jgi:hypothetical protein
MAARYSKLPYVLAILFGISILFLPDIEPFPLVPGGSYLLGASLFGFFWPKESWRWGIWIIIPIFALLTLSVAFSGQLDVKKDVPLFILGIAAACLVSYLFALIRHRTKPSKKSNP